jgi:PAS domain S-box-containing protein
MKLDIATITLITSIVYATQTIAVFAQYKFNKTYKGFGLWLAGAILQALGFLLMPAVGVPSIWMLAGLANPCVVAGQILLGRGIAEFLEKKERIRTSVSLFAVYALAYSYFIVLDDSILGRTVVVFLTTAAVTCRIAYSIWRGKKARFSSSAGFTAAIFALYGAFELAMTVVTLALPPLAAYGDIADAPIRVITFIVPIVASLLWTFGFILMANQRLNAENAEEREKMRMIFELSPDAVLVTRLGDGLVVDFNAGYLKLAGYERGDIIGKTTLDLGIWEDPADRERYLAELESRGEVAGEEFAFRKSDGSRIDGLISGRKMLIRDEAHIITIVYDVTERKLAERRIRDLLAEKELILKDVHHRIKNNMSTMRSLLSLQAEAQGEGSAASALEDAANRIQSMMLLYDKLYSSPDYKELPIAGYLSRLVDEIVSNFPNASSILVEKRLGDFVLGAAVLQPLGLIVNELLTNVMKYAFAGRDGGTITVSASLEGSLVTLVIADDGNGMPPSIDFERSTGFGLLLVQALTQQLKGKIAIERGRGTAISLEFER